MKKHLKYITIIAIVMFAIIIFFISINKSKMQKQDDGKFKIVTSFYPIYILTMNITQGANNIELVNMADTNVGCIHDYTLNTADMKKIENADIFIQNGLGLENFIDKIIETNSEMEILDSSQNLISLIKENEQINPHVWTSINNYIEQVKNISDKLIEKNPENKDVYIKNTEEYIKKLTNLKLKFDTQLQTLNGQKAVILNESFEYLGRDAELNFITMHTNHEESTLSAENLKNIINTMKQNNINIIIVDINDDIKNAQSIANGTGATIYKLDSGLTGNLSKDAYLNAMNGNLEILKQAIK